MPRVIKPNKDVFVRVVVSMNISYQLRPRLNHLQLDKSLVTAT